MAQEEDDKNWYDDEHYSSSRDSDDSPLLSHSSNSWHKRNTSRTNMTEHSYRNTADYIRSSESRSTLSVLMKFFLFCLAMISFCLVLYIPVYNWANNQVAKAIVSGWSTNTNRDTKLYVLPNNVTTLHEPSTICPKQDMGTKNKLFLLIIVCSATDNFDRRVAIRNWWGNYTKYLHVKKVFNKVREKYKNYNFTYDLMKENNDSFNIRVNNESVNDDSGIGLSHLLPELAKVLQSNLSGKTDEKKEKNGNTEKEEKRFDDDDVMLPEFDMNKELGEENDNTITKDYENYDYDTNVMKIPPRGFEESPDLEKILTLLKQDKNLPKFEADTLDSNTEVDFKLAFLLGLPNNDTDTAEKIENEIDKYGDVIQEDFIDSYNNLTLKSIMMLKWISNKCNESVRYILKTDDDMYVNVPNLVSNLRTRASEFDKSQRSKEYLLIGDLICGARPVLDSSNKWYSPRYMFGGRVYPRYLSGTGYVFSAPAARALYDAALKTPYFHLEDIYITGLCPLAAAPRLRALDEPLFSYQRAASRCAPHARATTHRVAPPDMAAMWRRLATVALVDKCERIRLTQIKEERSKIKYNVAKLFQKECL